MASITVRWENGKCTLSARNQGETGSANGVITGITPATAMNFAIMLARAARSYGQQWPTVWSDDPHTADTVDGLRNELGEPDARKISRDEDYNAILRLLQEIEDSTRTSTYFVGNAKAFIKALMDTDS